jgi:hypothetical protein
MILSTCSPGHVAAAVREAARRIDEPVRAASASDADLFMKALGFRAIVYAPEARLLEAAEGGSPEPERMRAIVSAAQAPGVERVVVVAPSGSAWEEEHAVLRKNGIGYTILRAQPLLDELADATNLHAARDVWLPRGKTVRLASADALARAVHLALTRDDWCGSTIDVDAESLDIAEAMRRAAALAGARVRVHVTSPSMSFAMRKLSLWMGLEPPELERLCDRLGSGLVAASA